MYLSICHVIAVANFVRHENLCGHKPKNNQILKLLQGVGGFLSARANSGLAHLFSEAQEPQEAASNLRHGERLGGGGKTPHRASWEGRGEKIEIKLFMSYL